MEQSFDTDPFDFLSLHHVIEIPVKGLIYIQITGSSLEREASQARNYFGVIHPYTTSVTCVTKNWPWFFVSLDYINHSTRIINQGFQN